MITEFRIKNFKSWKDTGALRFAPLTGFFGANSSGKSAILHSLMMLKQTAESPDRKRVLHTGDEKSSVDLGTFYDVLHNHDAKEQLETKISWTLPEKIEPPDPETKKQVLFSTDSLSFETTVVSEADSPIVKKFGFSFNGKSFGMERQSSQSKKYDLTSNGFHPKRSSGRRWPLPPPMKCYGFPDEAMGYYQNTSFLSQFQLAFEKLFASVSYLGPLREYPNRRYTWAGEHFTDVGQRGENAIKALLAAKAEGSQVGIGQGKSRRYYDVERITADWLREMNVIRSFSVKPIAKNRKDYEVRIKTTDNSAEVLITDVGFGVSQVLPVIVLCFYVPEGSTIILEQPEIHLHPAVQAGLADVFIQAIKERKIQIILESHSEHLLTRIQRRIAEGAISNSETAFYFCQNSRHCSEIEELKVDLFGNIENWPEDFFGDKMGDLVKMTEAAAARSKVS